MLQDEGQARNEEDKANDERALVLWNAAKAAVLEKFDPPTSLIITLSTSILTD